MIKLPLSVLEYDLLQSSVTQLTEKNLSGLKKALIGLFLILGLGPNSHASSLEQAKPPYAAEKLSQQFSRQDRKWELLFTENQGQWDPRIRFAGGQGDTKVWIGSNNWTIDYQLSKTSDNVKGIAVRLSMDPASGTSNPVGLEKADSHFNFILEGGSRTLSDVNTYRTVKYDNAFDSNEDIDVLLRNNQGELKYDVIVAPYQQLNHAVFKYEGINNLSVNKDGFLIAHTEVGDFIQEKPVTYYLDKNGKKEFVECNYTLLSKNKFTFNVDNRDESKTLVVDPTIGFATYLGGSNLDIIRGVAVDNLGNVTVVGWTLSTGFPVTPGVYDTSFSGTNFNGFITKFNSTGTSIIWSTFASTRPQAVAVDNSGNVFVTGYGSITTSGAYDTTGNGWGDVNVLKFDSTGGLTWATLLGGNYDDRGEAIAVGSDGSVYVTGYTESRGATQSTAGVQCNPNPNTAFPTTTGAFQSVSSNYTTVVNPQAATPPAATPVPTGTPAITPPSNLSATPTYLPNLQANLTWSDNSTGEQGFKIERKLSTSSSYTQIATVGANVTTYADATVSYNNIYHYRVRAYSGSTDSPYSNIAAVGMGGCAPGGSNDDAFLAKFNSTGTTLLYSSYIGGNGADVGQAIALDINNYAYISGRSGSTNFPITSGAYVSPNVGGLDAFVTKFDLTQSGTSSVSYSTVIGGSGSDQAFGLAVDSLGQAYVTGYASADYPTTLGAWDTTGDGYDAFVTKLNSTGSALIYSTFLGGSSTDQGLGIGVDSTGTISVVGWTNSANFPVSPNAIQGTFMGGGSPADGFVTKLDPSSSSLSYSSFFGGSGNEGVTSAAFSGDKVYVAGSTYSGDFPVTPGAYDLTHNGPSSIINGVTYYQEDGFVAMYDLTLPLPTPTPTATSTITPSPSPTVSPTPYATATPTPTAQPTQTPTSQPTSTSTVQPTATPTATPSGQPTPTPTTSPIATPTASQSPTPTPSTSPIPSATPTATASPTVTPTSMPTATPTPVISPTPTSSPTVIPSPDMSFGIFPIVECVQDNHDGSYTAHFGYQNNSGGPLIIAAGDNNGFDPLPTVRGQPDTFLDGRVNNLFTVNFTEEALTWTVLGNSSTASRNSPRCTEILGGCIETEIATLRSSVIEKLNRYSAIYSKSSKLIVRKNKKLSAIFTKGKIAIGTALADALETLAGLPTITSQCTNQLLCTEIDYQIAIDGLLEVVDTMYRQTKKDLRRSKIDSKKLMKVFKNESKGLKEAIFLLPRSTSVCQLQ